MKTHTIPIPKLPIGINLGHYEEASELFNSNILNVWLLKRLNVDLFRVIRFMDWQKTNHSQVVEFDELPLKSSTWDFTGGNWATFAGVPLDLCLHLANACQASAWICIPHNASDDCIRKMVAHVLTIANHKPIFEFSNEVWNGKFAQQRECSRRGIALGLATDYTRGWLFYQARRTAFLKQVVGDDGFVVVSGQSANPWIAQMLLEYQGLGEQIDAVAIGPYFGNHAHITPQTTLDQLARALHHEINTTMRGRIRRHKELATKYDIPLWGYEGGQHLTVANNDPHQAARRQLLLDINRNGRIGGLTERWLTCWFEEGGELICPYSLVSHYGNDAWGHIERNNGNFEKSSKFNALLSSMESRHSWIMSH